MVPQGFHVVPHGRASLRLCGARKMDQRAFGIQGPFGAPPFGTQRLFGNNVIWDPGVIRGPAIWDPGPLGIRTIGELGTFATQGPLRPSHWGSGPTPRDLEQGLGIWGKA